MNYHSFFTMNSILIAYGYGKMIKSRLHVNNV
jgi:hypothetical protein